MASSVDAVTVALPRLVTARRATSDSTTATERVRRSRSGPTAVAAAPTTCPAGARRGSGDGRCCGHRRVPRVPGHAPRATVAAPPTAPTTRVPRVPVEAAPAAPAAVPVSAEVAAPTPAMRVSPRYWPVCWVRTRSRWTPTSSTSWVRTPWSWPGSVRRRGNGTTCRRSRSRTSTGIPRSTASRRRSLRLCQLQRSPAYRSSRPPLLAVSHCRRGVRRGARRRAGCGAGVAPLPLLRRAGRRLDGHGAVLRPRAQAERPAVRSRSRTSTGTRRSTVLAAAFAPAAVGRRRPPTHGRPVAGPGAARRAGCPDPSGAGRSGDDRAGGRGAGRDAAVRPVRGAAVSDLPCVLLARLLRRRPRASSGSRAGLTWWTSTCGRWCSLPGPSSRCVAADRGEVDARRPVEAAADPRSGAWRYLRFWLVKTLVRTTRWSAVRRLPALLLYLRALGAKIGRGVAIFSRSVPVCTDLLTIGAGTVIRKESFFTLLPGPRRHDPDRAGHARARTCSSGRDGARHRDRRWATAPSWATRRRCTAGQAVPAGEHWHGSPAERDRRRLPGGRAGRAAASCGRSPSRSCSW